MCHIEIVEVKAEICLEFYLFFVDSASSAE